MQISIEKLNAMYTMSLIKILQKYQIGERAPPFPVGAEEKRPSSTQPPQPVSEAMKNKTRNL